MSDEAKTVTSVKQVSLVILSSDTGRGPWTPVNPEDVPAWVKDPANIARLVDGEECMKADEGDQGSQWYRAIPAADYAAIVKAQRKRERRAAKHRLH